MRKRRRILTVAALLVMIAVVDFLLLQVMDDGEPTLVRGWRLFLTVLLALFLALGKNSARWITVILTGLGSLGGFIALTVLFASGGFEAGAGLFVAWLGVVSVTYAGIAAFLAYSSGVSREIRRIAERI